MNARIYYRTKGTTEYRVGYIVAERAKGLICIGPWNGAPTQVGRWFDKIDLEIKTGY